MAVNSSPALNKMPSSPVDENGAINCDPSQPTKMLWDVDPMERSTLYADLGVNDLEKKAPPPPPQQHTTPTNGVTQDKPESTNDTIPDLTTPSLVKSEDHIHNGTSCSCKRRLLDDINSIDAFACLADEILLHIFKWLPLTTLTHCARVCKRWNVLVYDETLWHHINLSSRIFAPGILGNILKRNPVAVKLSRAKFEEPVFVFPPSKARKSDKKGGKKRKQSITTKVQYLDLTACDASPSALCEIIDSCGPLRKLSLESCMVNVSIMTSVGQKAHEMEELNLSMCEGIIEYGLMQLLHDMPNLTSLNLGWTSLNHHALETLMVSVPPKLEKLNLSGCRQTIEDAVVEQILFRCPNLRELDLSDTTALTEAIFLALLDHGKIQHLAINRVYSLHYNTFGTLARLKSLRALEVFGLIPDDVYDSVKAQFPDVLFNMHPFSAIARPTVKRKNYIWDIKCHD